MNREALDAINLGAADGLQDMGEQVLAVAQPHVWDRTPKGQGIIETGKAVTYVNARKVAGTGSAPRGAAVRGLIVTVVGYDFPARFQETGTSKQAAKPVLTPAMAEVAPHGGDNMTAFIKRRLGGVR
jgi:hypothetical protein